MVDVLWYLNNFRTLLLIGAPVFSAAEGVAPYAASDSLLVWLVVCSLAVYKMKLDVADSPLFEILSQEDRRVRKWLIGMRVQMFY